MKSFVRKLSTDDILIYDEEKTEAFLIDPTEELDDSQPEINIIALANQLVAAGKGIHFPAIQMKRLREMTNRIEFLS